MKVDGKELGKDSQVSVGPGSKIEFGSDAVFQARLTLKAKYVLFLLASMFGRAHLELNLHPHTMFVSLRRCSVGEVLQDQCMLTLLLVNSRVVI